MSLVAPSPLPLISAPPLEKITPSNLNQLIAARRLALIGDARVQVAPLVAQPIPGSSQSVKGPSNISINSPNPENNHPPSTTQSASSLTLSSVARRKQRLANDSVPSSAYTAPSPGHHAASPSQSSTSSGAVSYMSRNITELAPVGVVDMRFLIRQPPTVQKGASTPSQGQKPGSKSSSVGTPTSPSGPLSVTTPKNQRPKSTVRAAAAVIGKSRSMPSDQPEVTLLEPEKDANKHLKHAFLFRPDSEQPRSGPFVRYSPMYHYYHPYRNLHREAIKTEWARLHPVVERAPPQPEEQVVTPPRRTSGRHKKGANTRGTGGKGKDKKKGAAATADTTATAVEGEGDAANAAGGDLQGNDATATTPPPTNGRRSRANGKGKGGAVKGVGKGKNTRNALAASGKRKRTEFEEEEKAGVAKEEATPTPPNKRPRRGAAAASALALAAAAQETADDAGSPKDEASHAEGQEDPERRIVKRRMRPNARKTAAARAAAMEAKKQKKRSNEDGDMSGTAENAEDDEGAESLKDEENASKGEGSPKPETPRDPDVDPETQSVDKEDHQQGDESVIDPEADQDQDTERRSKPTRGKGGARGGPKGKGRRGGLAAMSKRGSAFSINTRGTPRGTPKSIPPEDDTESVAHVDDAASIRGAVEHDAIAHTPAKGKGKKAGEPKRRGNWRSTGPSGIEESAPTTPMLGVMDDVQMAISTTEDVLPTESVHIGEPEASTEKHEE
ncbi:SubName: Full=Uncharacterized protein {ECO:0000313/EMBL:CCA67595.1} [Serendipita indica DSM 11827]|nr:SubName: Full=Uncharacterized protein {ECO:0000313/EMBL:CCA67595.1} [Serendipita indica DSM 11827]